MVNEYGQLFTIEGIAAGMIMLFTTYLVLNGTSVYTSGDSHISNMQLEQIGSDALRMMNAPVNGTTESQLSEIVENNDTQTFNTTFLNYINSKTGLMQDNLHYEAFITYRKLTAINSNSTANYFLVSNRNLSGVENPVRVTEWVLANKQIPQGSGQSPRVVLVEVLLWRD